MFFAKSDSTDGNTGTAEVHDKHQKREGGGDYKASTDYAGMNADNEVKAVRVTNNATSGTRKVDASEVDASSKVPYLKN